MTVPACAQWRANWHPPLEFDPWFPGLDDGATHGGAEHYRFARSECRACPLVAQCRENGMDEEHGMWGGMTPRERRAVKKLMLAA